jgi:hypothetical protein
MNQLSDRAADSAIAKNEPGGIRTHDLRIKSPLLYRLSYGLAGVLIFGNSGRLR